MKEDTVSNDSNSTAEWTQRRFIYANTLFKDRWKSANALDITITTFKILQAMSDGNGWTMLKDYFELRVDFMHEVSRLLRNFAMSVCMLNVLFII